jgi:hypothetical protein
MDDKTRADLTFSVRMALRQVPRGHDRALGQPRVPGDELAERIVAATIVACLERSNWTIEPGPAVSGSAAPQGRRW